MTTTELTLLTEWMRSNGVLSLKNGDVEIVLGPAPTEAEESSAAVDKPSETLKSRPGKDGLTAREQIELYGRVIDAEE